MSSGATIEHAWADFAMKPGQFIPHRHHYRRGGTRRQVSLEDDMWLC